MTKWYLKSYPKIYISICQIDLVPSNDNELTFEEDLEDVCKKASQK